MNAICLKDNGGYNLYGVEITKHMKRIFPELKSAYLCFYAYNKQEATNTGNNYFAEKDIKNGEFEFNGDEILLEFKDGKKVKIWNSEWGGIKLLEN